MILKEAVHKAVDWTGLECSLLSEDRD
jgi:hypothetical protein